MRPGAWIDHLPPWLSWGAILTTGAFSPVELGIMALPLVAAAVVEGRCLDLGRHRRLFEVFALFAVLAQLGLRVGMVVSTVNTLFLLCGIRLMLPREAPQRRQLVLMGFLLFLVTAIATFEITFLLWALAWTCGAALVLLQQAWEAASVHRKGLAPPPPYRALLPWMAAILLIAAACFLVLPRQTLGLRFFPWGMGGLTGSAAGLSDRLDLFDKGPISPNSEVVLRILPNRKLDRRERERWDRALELLRGITLEGLRGQRWEPRQDTPGLIMPQASESAWEHSASPEGPLALEFFVAPSPTGIIPVPLGRVSPVPTLGMPVREGTGASLRWQYPSRRPIPLRLVVNPGHPLREPFLDARRRLTLTFAGEQTLAARDWSLRVAPGDLSPIALAERLQAELRTFAYTTRNPSGSAEDPLGDFLFRTRSGHCEYFASALATALRHREVPARVVNGYRLGPWIEEGGYWLVTQDQAHSWVEFYDAEQRRWLTADPTPPAPPSGLEAEHLWATLQRWADALRYRWDRRVVRYSGEDQLEALAWLQTQASNLGELRLNRTTKATAIGILLLAWALWRLRRFRLGPATPPSPHRLKPLRPLLRRTRKHLPPHTGETARTWLGRLAERYPEQAPLLARLADAADAVAYGRESETILRALVKEALRRSFREDQSARR